MDTLKGIKKQLIEHVEAKQLEMFEKRRKKTTRKQDRRYTQLIDALDDLRRNKGKRRGA